MAFKLDKKNFTNHIIQNIYYFFSGNSFNFTQKRHNDLLYEDPDLEYSEPPAKTPKKWSVKVPSGPRVEVVIGKKEEEKDGIYIYELKTPLS